MNWPGDPATTRRSRMEGWYWRVVDAAAERVVVALCGVCRPRRGAPWAVVAVAAHPGGFLRWGRVDGAAGADAGFGARASPLLRGSDRELRVEVGDATVEVQFERAVHPAGAAIGPAHALPGLPQYWHAHVVDARVRGHAEIGGERWSFDGARGYAEKNWGPAFAGDWWWGQAFCAEEVAVSFAGGRIALPGGRIVPPTALALRLGTATHRLFPPLASLRVATAPGAWRLRASRGGLRVEIEGEAGGAPHRLPVPHVELRSCPRAAEQHLAGRMRLEVREGRRLRFSGESSLAGLERGLPNAAPPS